MRDAAEARRYLALGRALWPPQPRCWSPSAAAPAPARPRSPGASPPSWAPPPGAVSCAATSSARACSAASPPTACRPRPMRRRSPARVFATIAERAAVCLGAGHAVIADAVYGEPAAAPGIAGRGGRGRGPVRGIWLEAPLATRMERVEARTRRCLGCRRRGRDAARRQRWIGSPNAGAGVRADRPADEVADEVLAMLAKLRQVLTCAVASRSRSCPASSSSPSAATRPRAWRRAGTSRPTARSPSSATGEDGAPEAAFARWGLLGPWMKEANDPGRQINARSETAAEKPMFRDSFRKGRCLIPATGFYEWQKAGSGPIAALLRRPRFRRALRLRRPLAPQPPRRRLAARQLHDPDHRRLAAPAPDPPSHAGDPARGQPRSLARP